MTVGTVGQELLKEQALSQLLQDYDKYNLTNEDLEALQGSVAFHNVVQYRNQAVKVRNTLKQIVEGSAIIAHEQQLTFHEKHLQLSAKDYFKALSDEFGGALEIMDISPHEQVVGRENKFKELTYILKKKVSPVAMLLAPAGAGKTALMKAWKLKQDEIGKEHNQIVALTMMKLSNGGDMAERMQRLIPALKLYEEKLIEEDEKARIVLFIDEAHTMVSAFDTTGVATKLGGELLKTALTPCPIRVVGATTYSEFETYIASDEALARRFDIVQVPIVDKATCRAILRQFLATYGSEELASSVSDDVLTYTIISNERQRMSLGEPAKSLQIIENALAIHETDGVPITKEVIDRVFASKNITMQQQADFNKIREVFKKRIIGQPLALLKIEMALVNMVIPTRLSDRPLMAMLLAGSTGVGKTATVKALAEALKGDRKAFHTFDMSVYTGKEGKERFQNRLAQIADNEPDAIILFDELEKALENQILLLQVLDEGRISYFVRPRDGGNEIERPVSLKGTKIFATTNAGHKMFDSMDKYSPEKVKAMTEEDLLEAWASDEIDVAEAIIGDGFRPEVYNRFQDVIPYYPLERKSKVEIARSMIDERVGLFEENYGVTITLPNAKKWGVAYRDVGYADEVSMFFGVEKQQGKGTTNGGARDIEKSIEAYFDYAIKRQMLFNPNIKRFTIKTNGLTNFEQNTSYEIKRDVALRNGIKKEDFDRTYNYDFKNRAGKLQVIPYTVMS